MKLLALLASCFLLTACVYSQHTNEHHSGASVSSQQIAQIEMGKTTKQWVLSNLGIPNRTQADKDGLEVYEYQSERTEKSNKTFIFLFNVDSDKVISRKVTRVVMRNGVVEAVNSNDLP
jgi:outer membrane protein assembly factor BamE (lipoprotein component of BamABCDE complex)